VVVAGGDVCSGGCSSWVLVVLVLVVVRDVMSEGSDISRGVHGHGLSSHAVLVVVAHRAAETGTEVIVPITVLFIDDTWADNDFDFAAHDHGEGFAADGLLDSGEAASVTPLVELSSESIGLEFEKAELAGGEEAMAPGGMDIGDGGVDDRGLGRATNLREIG